MHTLYFKNAVKISKGNRDNHHIIITKFATQSWVAFEKYVLSFDWDSFHHEQIKYSCVIYSVKNLIYFLLKWMHTLLQISK